MKGQLLFGAAENVVDTPLFAELGGFGPFLGRRNLGVRDPLYCRVLTFNDGSRRNVIVATDMITSGQLACRLLRMELASEYSLYPESIMFVGTHTHSGACVSSCDIGYGAPNAEFIDNWRRAVKATVEEAIRSEEPVCAFAGRAPIRKQLGKRRTAGASDMHTDPEIRFVKFVRPDSTVKALLHNHAMHGVVFGRLNKLVSADWMGDANAKIKARKLAEIPCFLYGTAGDINVIWTHEAQERDLNLEWIGTSYVDDLEAALDDAKEIKIGPCKAVLRAVEFPTEPVVASEYRAVAEKLLEKLPSPFENLLRYIHDRMIEMAVLAERGHDFRVIRDLQVLKMGELSVSAVPGEPFLEVGEKIRSGAKSAFPLAVSVANGDAGYYPTREMFEKYPTIFDCDDFGAFGFYEVWFGPGMHRPKFKPDIVDFLTKTLLDMETGL